MQYIEPNWPAAKHIKAFTTLRSAFPADICFSYPIPAQEKAHIKALFQLPNEPIWLNQVHGNQSVEARTENQNRAADALYTTQPKQVCTVVTADCLPILVCNKQGTHVAAIHAGWRGLASGILTRTLDALQLPSEDLLVWLGPGIGPTKFEVGVDVYEAFVHQCPAAARAFQPYKPGKWLGNLYELARMQLQERQITQIYGGDYCTHSQADLFFSYRRDGKQTGRIVSVIWIDE